MSIGLVHGVFDVVHHGHILHFKEAKKKVDYLICSVTSDNFVNKGPNKPLFKISERVEFLENSVQNTQPASLSSNSQEFAKFRHKS